ncbi:NAD-dependent succinate-semialdehyde dehydrogenase [Corynebacterium mendelii]|uniref:NAD-dependent succinate-semialdehyde dehydrogenase n=1 Tax=Corynebacterium mendelii TaxID=2765362 RepID=A0A939IVX3_9CORY|nr:NAD-dependent succinate-semialdehyde dehydrogenase [Corynebacterium mendelii]MBN9644691.1 NAD-dependent succinate-semialdehyde dehydrogenase [Corynebacterium mendelii]
MAENTQQFHELVSELPTGLFINGEFTESSSGESFPVINPGDGSTLCRVASATAEDARRALDGACAVQPEWAATAPQERADILLRAFDLLHDNKDTLALVQSLELGRALKDSAAEVDYGAEFFRWFAGEATRIGGDYRVNPQATARIVVHRQPVGPCLAVTPWNFPLAMGTRKLGPVIAAGCTMVLKPASKTPLTMLYLAKIMKQAGLPDGVFQVLPTDTADNVSCLLDDTRIRKFTFTGSTGVGQMLAARAAKNSVKVSLELGGNAPYVVFADADLEEAVAATATAKMRGAGQACIAANRFIVHESLAEEFTRRVAAQIAELTVGPGTDPATDVGCLSGTDQLESVARLVDDAVAKGATVHLGGSRAKLDDSLAGGAFYPPTVLGNVPADAEITRSEIFGPVVAVTTFTDDEDAIRQANDTDYGLAAYVFTTDVTKALWAAEAIESGMVAVNKGALSDPAAPFGGFKQSGLGREGGREGIEEFLETKYISLPR